MFDNTLRLVKEKWLDPFTKQFLIHFPVHPNTITYSSLIVGVLCNIAIVTSYHKLALLFWLLNRVVDGLDGTVARITNQQTNFGGLLDLYTDFIVYCSVPVSIICSRSHSETGRFEYLVLSLLLSAYMVNGVSWMVPASIIDQLIKKEKLTTLHMQPGLIEGFETIVAYSLWIIILPYSYQWTVWLMLLFAVLVLWTSLQRMYWCKSRLDPKHVE